VNRPSIASIVSLATAKVTLLLWAATLAVLAAGVVSLGVRNNDHGGEAESGKAALEVAIDSVGPILSYNAKTVEKDLAAAETLLTADFKTSFTELGANLVAPMAKRDHIDTRAKVAASALVSATSEKVVALVFINQTTTGKSLKEPRTTSSRLRITLSLVEGEWLVSDLQPI
jgi:Mce-associated membrane protein